MTSIIGLGSAVLLPIALWLLDETHVEAFAIPPAKALPPLLAIGGLGLAFQVVLA